jgi:hypothetical protein
LLLLPALPALAIDDKEPVHGPTVIVPEVSGSSLAVGDDCTAPIVISSLPFTVTAQSTCGRFNDYANTCLYDYDGGEDIIYQLDLAAATTINIVMNAGNGWTGIVIDDACPPDPTTCIATDSGSSSMRTISNLALAAGSYYIMVDTWPAPSCIAYFDLTIAEPTPPPPNDVCEGAIDLQAQGLTEFQVDLCSGYANDYNAGGSTGCTGYTSNGVDATYKIYLNENDPFSVTVTPGDPPHDVSIWLVTDCANAAATCVAGADATVGDDSETLTYTAASTGWYYLIVDGFSSCSLTTVSIQVPVATQSSTWGGVKALYH